MEIHCTKLNIWCFKASDIQRFKILIKQLFYCRLLDKRLFIASLALAMCLLFRFMYMLTAQTNIQCAHVE